MTEILDLDDERETLYDLLIDRVSGPARHALNPDLTVRDNMEVITAMVLTGVLHHLRVLSARQLGVLLGAEANRHEGWTIHEPPQYTDAERPGCGGYEECYCEEP